MSFKATDVIESPCATSH